MNDERTEEPSPDDVLPTEVLEQMPRYILDQFRSMLWELEVDGQYGLVSSRMPCSYTRTSVDTLRTTPGQYIPLSADHRTFGPEWRADNPSPAVNQIAALEETVRLAELNGMPELPGTDMGLAHLRDMLSAAQAANFPPDKLGRWLGWAQCAAVAADIGLTLADMKAVNVRAQVGAQS